MVSKAILFLTLIAACVATAAILTSQVPKEIAYPAFCICVGWTFADLIVELSEEREKQ